MNITTFIFYFAMISLSTGIFLLIISYLMGYPNMPASLALKAGTRLILAALFIFAYLYTPSFPTNCFGHPIISKSR